MRKAAQFNARSRSKCRVARRRGRFAVQADKALNGVRALSAERRHGFAGQLELARGKDL